MMKRFLIVFPLLLAMTSQARAERRDLEFLQELRDREMGDIAVLHLEQMEAAQSIPPELVETFDLEFGRSLMSEAETTANVNRAAQAQLRARARLEKFLQEHPDHPEAATAHRSVGQISVARGEQLRKSAERRKTAANKSAVRAQARAEFEQARPFFQKAGELFHARLNELRRTTTNERNAPRGRRGPQGRNRNPSVIASATEDWLEARFLAAQTDYLMALTYADPADPARQEALQRAAKGFDDIYQGNRDRTAGVLAHFWHGQTLEAAGDTRTALDVYQEVLGNAPEPGDLDAESRMAFFTDAMLLQLKLLQQLNRGDEAFAEAELWLDRWQSIRRLAGYQAIALEFTRMLLARAEGLDQRKSEKTITQALNRLNDMARIPGPTQNETIRLRRELLTRLGRNFEITSFADAVALAEGSIQSGQWQEAVKFYDQAMAFSHNVPAVARVDSVRLDRARAQFLSGDVAGAFESADRLARETPPRDLGPYAAVVAMKAALNLVVSAEDKEPARKRLYDIAAYTKSTWPKRAEADEASLTLGRLQLLEGDNAGAIQTFESVQDSSELYPQAQFYAVQTRWRMMQIERRSGELGVAAYESRRDEIIGLLQKCVDLHASRLSGSEEAPESYDDVRLQLAETLQDAGRLDEALAVYGPLVQQMMQSADSGFGLFQRRVASGAAAAYLAQSQLEQAKALGDALADQAEDIPAVNAVLVNVAQRLVEQWKQADDDARAANQPALTAFVEKVCGRQQTSLAEQIRLGTMAADLGRNDLARAQFERVKTSAESSTSKDPRLKAAVIGAQARLVGLLRREAEAAKPEDRLPIYQRALTEADELLKETPRALEPNLERARILQAIAEAEPSKYSEAAAAWTRLRLAMPKTGRKPPEYFEIVYYAAAAINGQASMVSDSKAAADQRQQAVKLLKGTLLQYPSLNGPEMVDQYNALLQELSASK